MSDLGALLTEIQEARSRILQAVEGVSEEQARYKRSPEEWSIQEVLEHLTLAEESILKLVSGTINRLKAGKSLYSGEHTNKGLTIKEIVAKGPAKAKAPEPVQPTAAIPWNELRERYRAIDRQLPEQFRLFEEVDLRSLLYPHAFLGVMDMHQWLELIYAHAQNHLKQIEAIQQSPGYPPA
ncbi:MAG: DinB family protein [Nitrospinota bacterium]|nr:MAG: DinB family protein [Nitrospinota bacterium]